MLSDLTSDLRGAVRALRRHPLFSTSIVGVLGIGIGAAALIFSVVSGILLRPLPFARADDVVMIWGDIPQIHLGFREIPIGGRYFTTMRTNATAFTSLAALRAKLYNLDRSGGPERVDGAEVTGEFFQTIGVAPALGRGFQRADETPGSHVVVVSWTLWQERLGGDPLVVGSQLVLNGEPYTVVGVAPAGFAFPRGSEMPANFELSAATQIWVAMAPPRRGPSDLMVIGRLQRGVGLAAAEEDLSRLTRIQEALIPQGKGWFGTRALPLRTQMVGEAKPILLVLLAAVGLLLAIACANAGQLLLARLAERRRELAIRESLGASTTRLVRSALVEALALTCLAGAVGGVASVAGAALVRAFGPAQLPRLADVTVDLRVIAVLVAITLVVGTAIGLAPARLSVRGRLAHALRGGVRGSSAGARAVAARRRLIVVEIALSLVLVAGSGLLIKSVRNQIGEDPGFATAHAVTFEVTLPPGRYPEHQFSTYMEHPQSVAFFAAVLDHLRALPGGRAAAIGKPLPLSGAQEATVFAVRGDDPRLMDPAHPPVAEYTVASPGLFSALGTTLAAGRDFAESDREDAAPVVIINQAMAQWLWPGADPLGKRLKIGGLASRAPWMTVIGVVGDMKRYSLTQVPRPEMFVPYTQKPYPTFATMQFIVRMSPEPLRAIDGIRRAVATVDPTIPVARVRTLGDLMGEVSARARLAAVTMTAFGATALFLAALGVYGLVAYAVQQRRQEFGVRLALGATRGGIVRLVLADGLRLSGVAVVVGVAGSAVAALGLRSMLYRVSALDPAALGTAVAVLLVTTTLACAWPAFRAAGVDPRAALQDS